MHQKMHISIHYTLPIILDNIYKKTQDSNKVAFLKTIALYTQANLCTVLPLALNIIYVKYKDYKLQEPLFKALCLSYKST
jgi:hypothetical protein